MKLSEVKIGKSVLVDKILCSEKIKKRLKVMGLTENMYITLIRVGFFGSPIEIKVRDCYIAIRQTIAENIMVKDE